ncbi:hypothetical protein CRUP_011341 [Coryphaenoides rupestris]|nr:hypothetical protein CRUP_011341 [Coryphaenoides rupestris]
MLSDHLRSSPWSPAATSAELASANATGSSSSSSSSQHASDHLYHLPPLSLCLSIRHNPAHPLAAVPVCACTAAMRRFVYCKVVLTTSLVWVLVDVFLLLYFSECNKCDDRKDHSLLPLSEVSPHPPPPSSPPPLSPLSGLPHPTTTTTTTTHMWWFWGSARTP